MTTEELDRVQDYIDNMELDSRKDEFKFKRYYLMKYLRVGASMSYKKIGHRFCKDHVTVISAINRLEVLEGCVDYEMHTKALAIEFPMDGLLVNSKTFNGIKIANSMKELEQQFFYTNPCLTK